MDYLEWTVRKAVSKYFYTIRQIKNRETDKFTAQKMKKSLIENFIVRAVIGKTHKNGYLANLIMLNSTIMESTNSDFPRFEWKLIKLYFNFSLEVCFTTINNTTHAKPAIISDGPNVIDCSSQN